MRIKDSVEGALVRVWLLTAEHVILCCVANVCCAVQPTCIESLNGVKDLRS